ncbi:hypothetical protein LD837_19530 [Salmonella enterica]|nr:hypothetical protein [Salmonella enterica]
MTTTQLAGSADERAKFEAEYSKICGLGPLVRGYFRVWTAAELDEEEASYIGKYFNSDVEKCWQLWLSARSLK